MDNLLGWMKNVKKSSWLLGALVVALGLFSLYRMKEKGGAADYLNADALYAKWQANGGEELASLEKMLKRRQELHGKFDANIAQHLLSLGKAGAAESYATNVLKRNSDLSPLCLQFSRTSLMMGKGDYRAALEESKKIKEELKGVLKVCNLVRIASLEQKVGTPQDELEAWQAVLKDECFPILQSHLYSNQSSLLDYIEYRKSQLSVCL